MKSGLDTMPLFLLDDLLIALPKERTLSRKKMSIHIRKHVSLCVTKSQQMCETKCFLALGPQRQSQQRYLLKFVSSSTLTICITFEHSIIVLIKKLSWSLKPTRSYFILFLCSMFDKLGLNGRSTVRTPL